MTRDRISDKARILAEQGLWNAGRPPFGYVLGEKRSLVIDEREASTVRLIFKQAARGVTPYAIAEFLRNNHATPAKTPPKAQRLGIPPQGYYPLPDLRGGAERYLRVEPWLS